MLTGDLAERRARFYYAATYVCMWWHSCCAWLPLLYSPHSLSMCCFHRWTSPIQIILHIFQRSPSIPAAQSGLKGQMACTSVTLGTWKAPCPSRDSLDRLGAPRACVVTPLGKSTVYATYSKVLKDEVPVSEIGDFCWRGWGMKTVWSTGVDSSGVLLSSVCDTVSILLTWFTFAYIFFSSS